MEKTSLKTHQSREFSEEISKQSEGTEVAKSQKFIPDVHKKFGPSVPSLTLYKYIKRVWILSGRQQVKKAIIHK